MAIAIPLLMANMICGISRFFYKKKKMTIAILFMAFNAFPLKVMADAINDTFNGDCHLFINGRYAKHTFGMHYENAPCSVL